MHWLTLEGSQSECVGFIYHNFYGRRPLIIEEGDITSRLWSVMVNSEGVHFYCEKYGTKSLSKYRRFYVVFELFARDLFVFRFCVGASVLCAF